MGKGSYPEAKSFRKYYFAKKWRETWGRWPAGGGVRTPITGLFKKSEFDS